MPKLLLNTLFAYIVSFSASAQMNVSDTNDQKAILQTIEIYSKALGNQSPIYNGSEYLSYPAIIQEGHVFFETNSFINGTVRFDGMVFNNVPIMYDILKDQLIIQHYNGVFKINLTSKKVDYFTLDKHTFIYLPLDSEHSINPGFYEKLYHGKSMALAKRIKEIKEETGDLQLTLTVVQKNSYYIKKEGKYYNIRNSRELMSLLKDKKKEIQQYLNKNHIRFKKQPEQTIAMAMERYDQLTN